MARLARLVIPGLPHHVTQRGNGRQQTFFEDGDYALYRDLLAQSAERAARGLGLLPDAQPCPRDRRAVGRGWAAPHLRRSPSPLHGLYQRAGAADRPCVAGAVRSVAMDEAHLASAVRYVSLNPVRARLVKRAADWRWSSVRAHFAGADDHVVRVAPVLERVGDFAAFLAEEVDEAAAFAPLRQAESIGRPIGNPEWIEALERRTGRQPGTGQSAGRRA